MINYKSIICTSSTTIKEAMSLLDTTSSRIVLVADEGCHLLGTVTDGDIRRGLLKGASIEDTLDCVMNENPVVAEYGLSLQEIKDLMKEKSVLAVPLVDSENKIVGLEKFDDHDVGSHEDTVIVLMAGGFGKRLQHYTEKTPKPMLTIGDTPIIERTIINLKEQGFKRFYITTYYKHEVIINYLTNKIHDIHIEFVVEDKPLGTAGSLTLLKKKFLKDPSINNFFVMNSDLIVKTDFNNILDFHENHKEIGTICTKNYEHQIPYGVIHSDDSITLKTIEEKPLIERFINTGIYCFNKKILEYVSDTAEFSNMTSMLEDLMKAYKNINIRLFPIHEYWIDIGSIADYQKASSSLEQS